VDWDPDTFASAYAAALDFLAGRCARVLTATAPLHLGVPPAGEKVAQLNAIIAAEASRRGALVVDLRHFGARNHVMADRVHPTAFGQIAIAERALGVLAGDGMTVRVAPSSLIVYETTWRGRLRGDLSYAYRSAKEHLSGGAHRWRGRRPAGR
jgi:hypothetical protein